MYDDKAYQRFCDRMTEVHAALGECEKEVDEMRRSAEKEISRFTGRFVVMDLSNAEKTGESEISSAHHQLEDAKAALAAHPHRADCLIFDRFTLQEVK